MDGFACAEEEREGKAILHDESRLQAPVARWPLSREGVFYVLCVCTCVIVTSFLSSNLFVTVSRFWLEVYKIYIEKNIKCKIYIYMSLILSEVKQQLV